ncbi:MAG: hypothetical protein EBR82_30930 [Caulobacteraceae bacterium]|nr:hypothetical protein [Caulobacteraceae bacterium]NDD03616.1 hypothetical protein [Pseudomonadota bacterium]NDG19001.1 hypothetical protein [Betaproteobacteria bacterium]
MIDREIDGLELKIKELKRQRGPLEELALEEMAASRMERGVPAGSRSWRVEWEHSFSVSKDRLPKVMEALKAEGALELLLTVNTATLKKWLKEKAEEAGTDARQPFSSGTAFDGLVGEFVRPVLRHLTTRRGGDAEATEQAF